MSDGQMIDCSFSKWSVNNLPEGDGNDSNDEKDDNACGCIAGDTAPDAPAPDLRGYADPVRSSPDDTGEASPLGDTATPSSASDAWALSSEAAKLLDISGSETNANDDCVDDVVDIVDVVRSRADSRGFRGSSCHAELATSTFPYSRPYIRDACACASRIRHRPEKPHAPRSERDRVREKREAIKDASAYLDDWLLSSHAS